MDIVDIRKIFKLIRTHSLNEIDYLIEYKCTVGDFCKWYVLTKMIKLPFKDTLLSHMNSPQRQHQQQDHRIEPPPPMVLDSPVFEDSNITSIPDEK